MREPQSLQLLDTLIGALTVHEYTFRSKERTFFMGSERLIPVINMRIMKDNAEIFHQLFRIIIQQGSIDLMESLIKKTGQKKLAEFLCIDHNWKRMFLDICRTKNPALMQKFMKEERVLSVMDLDLPNLAQLENLGGRLDRDDFLSQRKDLIKNLAPLFTSSEAVLYAALPNDHKCTHVLSTLAGLFCLEQVEKVAHKTRHYAEEVDQALVAQVPKELTEQFHAVPLLGWTDPTIIIRELFRYLLGASTSPVSVWHEEVLIILFNLGLDASKYLEEAVRVDSQVCEYSLANKAFCDYESKCQIKTMHKYNFDVIKLLRRENQRCQLETLRQVDEGLPPAIAAPVRRLVASYVRFFPGKDNMPTVLIPDEGNKPPVLEVTQSSISTLLSRAKNLFIRK